MIKKIGFDEIREYSEIRIDVSAKGVDEYNFYNADNIIILNHYLNMWNNKWSQIFGSIFIYN